MKDLLIVVSAPSGAGKTSFLEKIIKEVAVLQDTVTYTTRAMREGESEGHPYHFIDEPRFKELINQQFFVEWAHVHSNLYGTSRLEIMEIWQRGRIPIMDVDVQGARTFKSTFPGCRTIFILPPSLEVLKERIIRRDGKTPDLAIRMRTAESELHAKDEFDFKLINDDFAISYGEFKKIVEALLKSR